MVDKSSALQVDLGRIANGLADTCADYLATHRTKLETAIAEGQRGTDVARRYADMFDGLLSSLYCASLAAVATEHGAPGRVALVAVGGYGRQLVGPHSDADVLFLCDDPEDRRIAAIAEAVLYPLWDCGVDIGHAVRGLGETLELARTDIRTSTTLLDVRQVAGDRELVAELGRRGDAEILQGDLPGFLDSLDVDTLSRHERYGGSLYMREPEIKLGRGGLRDLDVVFWSARACWGRGSAAELAETGAFSEHEAADLEAAQGHLWAVRNLLHSGARRRHDRLTFEDQVAIAEKLGYRDGQTLGVEQFMQAHYRHARSVARLVDRMTDRARRSSREPPNTIRDLGGGVLVHDAHVTLSPDDLKVRPVVALRLYRAAVRDERAPDPGARDAIAAACENQDWCRALRKDGEAAALFLQLLTHAELTPMRRGSVLEELHEVGLLLALVPEFEPVTGRVRFDAFHTYTVDAHAVAAVDRLRALVRGELAREFFVVSRCAAEMPRPVPLYLSLLLGGLGVGHPDDPHKHGAAIAGPVAERLGLDASDTEHMQWLIRNQGDLYHFAMRRDIADPEVITELAQHAESVHRLRDLYLLTFSTLSTVNPDAMTDWNARMLEDLWTGVTDCIQGRRGPDDHLQRVRRDVLLGVDNPEHRAELESFLSEMPERYLLANTVTGIRFHADVVAARDGEPAIAATDSGVGAGTLELLVSVDDRPGLLVDLTAALAASRFSVDAAQLYTRQRADGRREGFDLFHLAYPDGGEGVDLEAEKKALIDSLRDVLNGVVGAAELVDSRPRPPSWLRSGPRVRTEINVDNAASRHATVIDVYTRDRKDLLHAIAHTLHEAQVSIALAKVNTEGNRAVDVFYVQDGDGGKVSGQGRLAKMSEALRKALRKQD